MIIAIEAKVQPGVCSFLFYLSQKQTISLAQANFFVINLRSPHYFILFIQPMSKSSGILYQDSSYCLPCWADPKERLPSPPSHFSPSGGREAHERKVSLKKYNFSRLKRSQLQLPISQPLLLQNYSKTTRVFEPAPPEPQLGRPPLRVTFAHQCPLEQRQAHHPETAFDGKPGADKPESVILAKTTKLERILPSRSDQLKKTKKDVAFQRVVNLSELKESVCSFTDSCNQSERMEESQILMDYFHPTEKRISEMEQFIRSKELSVGQHQ